METLLGALVFAAFLLAQVVAVAAVMPRGQVTDRTRSMSTRC